MDMFDEARAIQSTMQLCRLTQSELAKQLGVSQSYVANKLRLLRFSDAMAERIRSSKISERHARALLRLENEDDILRVLTEISERRLTVRESEALVEKSLMTSLPERLGRKSALLTIDDFRRAIVSGCELLSSLGITAHTRTSYLGNDLYITVVVKDA